MCGEKLSAVFTSCINLGSPPRVRGKVSSQTAFDNDIRITPACAGKSGVPIICAPCVGDHPRVCGEKTIARQRKSRQMGSPPRVRGKGSARFQQRLLRCITPACAGKRQAAVAAALIRKDHPRVCGEKRGETDFDRAVRGSPPRVRGKDELLMQEIMAGRITPACAGKSPPAYMYDR